jgi:2-polyprenyl-3-methyl-5-hydroxy-6-metoxy-1,4-benzoquinol methylase
VLAVDLSLTSLGYAMRKTRELAITNIDHAQADILKLGTLSQTFDVIEACGVLHHLDDPFAGWRVLLELLRPGGFMYLGLYSALGRKHIVNVRSLIAERGYRSSPDHIRVSLMASARQVVCSACRISSAAT